MINLLLFNNFYTDEFERKRKRRIIVLRFGHSLWSAQPVASAKGLRNEERQEYSVRVSF